MIDISNGNLSIDNKTTIIGKELTKDSFISSDLFIDVIRQDDYGYTRYIIKPQLIDNDQFSITLIFKPDGILDFVFLGIAINGSIPSWENWSEEKELQKKTILDEWMKKNFSAIEKDLSWGSIGSFYDPRSASSHITIRYKPF